VIDRRRFWVEIAAAALMAVMMAWALPKILELFAVINATVYAAMALLALSLALVWGYGGILSFGQTAFFGLGGYAYAVAALNVPDPWAAVPVALLVPTVAAAALGYLMFYGRISDVYVGVITLTVSLILYNFVNSTAGDQWRIGAAPLGGFNGIPSTPLLTVPGDPTSPLTPEQLLVLAIMCVAACYIGCRFLLLTKFGRVAVAIKENELRAELLGYDVRLYKLSIFTIGGLMAGLSGVLFANCVFVSPTMFSLFYSGQIIIWVMIGGVGTLVGPITGAVLLQMLMHWAGTLPNINPSLLLGIVLTLIVLALPQGLQPAVTSLIRTLGASGRSYDTAPRH
jgi:ABC-type branched-subunit amino acid transport system permease subunit